MTTCARTSLTVCLFLAVTAAGALLVFQRGENATLRAELRALPVSVQTASEGSRPPALTTAKASDSPPLAAEDGIRARKELARRIIAEKTNPRRLDWKEASYAQPLLEGFSVQELKKMIGDVPIQTFNGGRQDDPVPDEIKAEDSARALALRRLSVIAPEEALKLCMTQVQTKSPDHLFGAISYAINQWIPRDPSAALHWARTEGMRLPAGIKSVNWVLKQVAEDDMRNACDLARSQGLPLTDFMEPLSSAATSADVETLMMEIAAEQSAAPGGFVEGSTKQYETLTQRIAAAQGFEGARAFAEKWAAVLPLRDDVALAAVTSALSLRSHPKADAAADWMMEFIPEARRAAAVEKLISTWADADFTAPAEWLQNHKDAPSRDAGLAALCRKIAPFDPDAAAEWAAGIADETLRASATAAPAKTP